MKRFQKLGIAIAATVLFLSLGVVYAGGIYGDGANMFGPVASNGSWDVNVSDQTSEVIDLHLTRFIDTMELTAPFNIDATTASVSSNTTPLIGDTVCFKEGSAFYQSEILTVTPTGGTGYDLLLDTPSDFNYTTAGGCSLRNQEMNVDGSVTPAIFSVSPSGLWDPLNASKEQRWDVVRIMFQITDDVSMDDAKFGGISALTNGMVIRKKDGVYKNIFNAKSNSDFALHAYDINYSDRAPAGFFGFRVRRTFGGNSKNGVVLRLEASSDDEVQVTVRDDLTDLETFHGVIQGHIVTD